MKREALLLISLFLSLSLALPHASHAQLITGPGVTDATSSQAVSNRNFVFSGTIPGQLDGALSVNFSIYPDQQSATALWTETQIVQITAEKYSVMLGSTSATGLPSEIFSAEQAHWLGVQVNGAEKRYLLVSVPYAMKAVNADQLGGLPFSEYVTAQQLQAALQSAATPGTSTSTKTTSTGPTGQAAAAGTTPQPATDFTDNNTSEVLLVTQQGTGYAIHAITSSQAEAILAQNDGIGGTALHAFATNATGASIGVLAETASPNGIAGEFNNRAGGKILSLRNNGVEVASVDSNGNVNASGQVQASNFVGGGTGLTNIPPAAVGATPFNNANTIVARDSTASFAANQIFANNFQGNGSGLFNIPQSAIGATSFNNPNTVVARDSTASFAANQIFANNFLGNGSGLSNIPQSAIDATSFNNPNTVVARDSTASFAANQIFANNFLGNGSGLFNIPQSAIGATSFNNPNTVVARDSTASFAANQIFANMFSGNGFGLVNVPQSAINATSLNQPNTVVARDANGGFAAGNLQVINQLTSSGLVDFSGAVTFPVRTVLTANIPPLCFSSKELLLVTDAFPGQQLFVCNSTGNGWVLLGDGGGSGGSSNVSGNTTGTLENVSQLGSGTGLTVSSTSGTAVSASSTSGTAIHGDSTGVGAQGSSQGGIGVWAAGTANDSTGTALLLSHASAGKLISGGEGADTNIFETFSVTAEGDVTFNGGMMTPYETTGTWFASSLVKLTSIPGNFGAGTVAMTSPGDTSGVIGIISGLPASGSSIQVVQSGEFFCNFDGPATSGHYVGISKITAGDCADIGANYPTDGQQVVGRVLSSFVTGTGRVLLFQSELHGGAGSSFTINTGAGLTGGPITSSGTISVADGGITAAKLAPNAVTSTSIASGSITTTQLAANAVTSANLAPNSVTSVNIADGSLPPAKINGTAATLGSNTFLADQTIQTNLTVKGTLLNNLGLRTSNLFVSESTPSSITQLGTGPALVVAGGSTGISISGSGTALSATADFGTTVTAQNTTATALQGIGPVGVDAVTATGVGLQARTTSANGVAATFTNANTGKLISGRLGLSVPVETFSVDTSGNIFGTGALITQFPNDNKTSGTTLSVLAELTPAGTAVRAFDSSGIIGIVVGGAGFSGNAQIAYGGIATCAFHTTTQAGDYVQNFGDGFCKDVGPSYPTSGQVVGRVVQSVPITDSVAPVLLFGPEQRTFPPASGVTNINTGGGLIGGPITSSGTISIANSGVTNAMLQNSSVSVTTGAGLSGGGVVPLGGSVALSNTGALSFNGRAGNVLPAQGDYSFSQLNGAVSPAQLPPSVVYNNQGNDFSGRQVITGTAAVNDSSASGGLPALESFSQNNVAGEFISNAPFVLIAGNTTTGGLLSLTNTGVLTVTGNIFGSSFIGDGSRLTNVNAASVGGVTAASLATTSGLNAETTARQSDVSTLQTNINNLSAADAKLAASNTFTAGTQDFSGAGATLPVHSVLTANTPTACVASKELLIKTDAPAGQQLFICDNTGTTWNLVGDGTANGVSSFNGRNGSVTPASGDYSFGQISGAAASSQLPSSVVYNNQANSFTGNQTVNGAVTATSFSGSGSALTGVNAASLNGLAFGSFAQLAAANTFTAKQTLAASTTTSASLNVPAGSAPSTPAAGDVWNTGSTLQYRDNASTTRSLVSTTQSGGLQLLKLTASITPASVASQVCTEQSFSVSGITTSDVLLGVAQPSTSSPGTNIAIGGFRVSAANTVAVQFCNVSRNNSTPTSGVYTFALMR